MPQVIGSVTEDTGSIWTNFTGTVTEVTQTFTFSEQQDGMTFVSKGFPSVLLTVNGKTNTIPPYATIKINDEFTSFDVSRVTPGSHSFDITSFKLKGDVNDVDDFSVQLAESEQYKNQNDFVSEIAKNINLPPATIAIDFGDPQRHFRLIQPVSSTQGFQYVFEKNANDDYIIMLDGHIASISKSELLSLAKNFDSMTGSWNTASMPSYYATTVGATFLFSFTGTGFSFNHFADNRGGVWEFVTKDSKNVTVSTVQKSTWNATNISNNNQVVVNGLSSDTYTVVATFMGDDPLHVPSGGAGTSRGWIVFETRPEVPTKSLKILDLFENGTKTDDVLYSYSNKEFALSCRPFSSGYAFNFVPEHNAIGTAFKLIDQQLTVNGNLTDWKVVGRYIKNVQNMQLVQKVQGKSPEDGQPFVEITTIHSYKNGVMSIQGKAKFIKKTELNVGYGTMIPYFLSFSNKMKSSFSNVYPTVLTDGSHTNLTAESDQATSYVFLNDTGKPNYVLAVTVDTPSKTFRYGENQRGNPFAWIENRNSTLGKVYFQPFNNAVVDIGYTYNFSSRFLVGIIPNIMDLIL